VSAAAQRPESGQRSGHVDVNRGGDSRIASTGRSYFSESDITSSRPLQFGVASFDPFGASKMELISTSTRM
jgi:hypothetical protein